MLKELRKILFSHTCLLFFSVCLAVWFVLSFCHLLSVRHASLMRQSVLDCVQSTLVSVLSYCEALLLKFSHQMARHCELKKASVLPKKTSSGWRHTLLENLYEGMLPSTGNSSVYLKQGSKWAEVRVEGDIMTLMINEWSEYCHSNRGLFCCFQVSLEKILSPY